MFSIGLVVLFTLFVVVVPVHNRGMSKKVKQSDRGDRSNISGKERTTTTRSGAGFYYKK